VRRTVATGLSGDNEAAFHAVAADLCGESTLPFSRRIDDRALNSMQRRTICANRTRTKYPQTRNFQPMKYSTARVVAALISNAFAGA
jgi:hypothetical protein